MEQEGISFSYLFQISKRQLFFKEKESNVKNESGMKVAWGWERDWKLKGRKNEQEWFSHNKQNQLL